MTGRRWLGIVLLAFVVLAWGAAVRQHSHVRRLERLEDKELRVRMIRSKIQAEGWLLSNQRQNGTFLYLYDVDRNAELPGDNAVRQLMAARTLAEISGERPELEVRHRRSLGHVLENWYRVSPTQEGYIYFQGNSKLGANAMALRTLVASPFFNEYKGVAKTLAAGIVKLVNPDGTLRPWFIEPGQPYDGDYLLKFYSGEAILALAEYGERSGDSSYLDQAQRIQSRYVELYVEQLEANYYPAYVPWHVMSLGRLFHIYRDPTYPRAVFILTDKLLEIQDQSAFPGRFHDAAHPEYGRPHVASDAIYTEGLAHAYELATLLGDVRRGRKYRAALHLGIRNLLSLQIDSLNHLPHPQRARGAFQTNVGDRRIRLDNVQHAIDALQKALQVLDGA